MQQSEIIGIFHCFFPSQKNSDGNERRAMRSSSLSIGGPVNKPADHLSDLLDSNSRLVSHPFNSSVFFSLNWYQVFDQSIISPADLAILLDKRIICLFFL